MKRYFFLVFLCCSILSGFTQNSSSIDFVIKNVGINVDGHFNTFTIKSDFDNEGRLKSISGKIKVSSIKTGLDSRDEHLLEEGYFYNKKYEFITLESSEIEKIGDNSYTVKANLLIKGISKKISIRVDVIKINDSYKISSNFEINRKDFKVGGGSFVLSKTVKINVVHYQKL